jgi:hypothetical protein
LLSCSRGTPALGGHYTFLKVKRAVSDLKLRKDVEPYALAAACSLEELRQNGTEPSAEHYQLFRD